MGEKPEGKRTLERSRHRWGIKLKQFLKEVGYIFRM
jgi:hypothetical protein